MLEFHLHHRLARELLRRGHEVATLQLDRTAHTFWSAQEQASTLLEPEPNDPMRAPLAEFAELECLRRGTGPGHPRFRRIAQRIERQLGQLLPPVVRWLSHHQPDLVLLHGNRTAKRRLLHFVGRELGCRVLWTGDGLLPHTMQLDEHGLDAEASTTRRQAFDYRVGPNDPDLLDACLANMLAHTTPSALVRREIRPPPLGARLADALAAVSHGWSGLQHAIHGWRAAEPGPAPPFRPFSLPDTPFLTVLLQTRDDQRVRLDAEGAPSPIELVTATVRAARDLDPTLRTVAVLPERGLFHRDLRALMRVPGLVIAASTLAGRGRRDRGRHHHHQPRKSIESWGAGWRHRASRRRATRSRSTVRRCAGVTGRIVKDRCTSSRR